jgi:disulfide bond formation protein DsbB
MSRAEKKPPCRVCMSIRIFLMCVFGLVIIGIIDRDLVAGIAKLSPLFIAIVVVGIFASLALLKAITEYRQLKSKSSD